MKITRKKFLAGLGGAGLIGGLGAYGWMRKIEPDWFDVHRVEVKLRGMPPGWRARVLHLSDFHLSPGVVTLEAIAQAVELGLAQKPDLVCLTGDYISALEDDPEPLIPLLEKLGEGRSVFACLGNHDGGENWGSHNRLFPWVRVARTLTSAGVVLLHNRSTEWRHRGAILRVAGVGDLWQQETRPELCLSPKAAPAASPTLLLNHNPDAKEFCRDYAWDLMLCGHTHGGQLILPFIGTPFAPVRDRRFVQGLNPYDGRLIYTTRGVGNLHGLRFNCRPWVSVLELVAEA